MWFSTSSGRIEFRITLSDARSASHCGDCLEDVRYLRTKPYIRRQLAKIDPGTLRDELREYGAWDDDELANHEDNLDRVLWLACGDIAEEHIKKGR